jgi:hypothetical protein
MSDTRRPLADVINAFGRAVDEGLVSRDEAVEHLTADYGLTQLGAEDVLKTWQSIHERYEKSLKSE